MFYADTEKFFDKLWLGDVIMEVWRRGTNSESYKECTEKPIIYAPVGDFMDIVCKTLLVREQYMIQLW